MYGENGQLGEGEMRNDPAVDGAESMQGTVGDGPASLSLGSERLIAEQGPNPGLGSSAASPVKVCRSCSVQSQTDGAFCPNCGKGFERSRPLASRKVRLAVLVVAAITLLGGGVTAVSMVVAHNNEVAADSLAADKAAAAKSADAAQRAARDKSKRAADVAERALRKTSVAEIETSITTDAQTRADDGTLDGPILRSSCTPLGGGSTDDLTALTTTFSCIAINLDNADGTASGYRFAATMNWDSGSYTWHLGD